MPVVPFAPLAPAAPKLPDVAPEFMAMAAAGMEQAGRLYHQVGMNEAFDKTYSDTILNKNVPEYKLPRDSQFDGKYKIREDMEEPEQGKNFETLYKQLGKHLDLAEDDYLLLYTEKGNQFWYRRDNNKEPGFRLVPRPEGMS